MRFLFPTLCLAAATLVAQPAKPDRPEVLFDTAFESGSIGKIEKLGDNDFRLHLEGQQDARGRNRQATWFYFRMDEVAGRELTLRFNSFKGEYNDKPAPSPTGAWFRPVISEDNVHWTHLADAKWEVEKDELTVQVKPRGNTLWIAHIPPYPHSRVVALVTELGRGPHVRTEVIGESVLGRPLQLVTVTDFARPDAGKKVVWLQARQHAWECGTSFVLEGALRFIVSDDPAARRLRDENVFKFVPMINPDSVANGDVRFNARGFDPNRRWDEVDLRDKAWLERAPEIWYVKKAILAQQAQQPIDIAVNMHNTEMNEYFETMADTEPVLGRLHRFFDLMVAKTTFDPSPSRAKLTLFSSGPANSTNSLWREARVPMMLMEQRIGPSQKLRRIVTTEDRLELGRQMIAVMAEAVK